MYLKNRQEKMGTEQQDNSKIKTYFLLEWKTLLLVGISGILYNIGMTAGPYFEGQLAQRLFDVLQGKKTLNDMLSLALVYLAVIAFVQAMRYVKRFYVRRFANNTGRNMRHILYNSLVHKSKAEYEKQSVGAVMTRAMTDVDACVEGMRKATTEVFDTGVVLVAYLVMLFYYDWRLALLASAFTPAAYVCAGRLKKLVYRYNSAYKQSEGRLNDATMDRISHALIYRVFGREENRNRAYDSCLADYERKACFANIWENSLQPIYNMISMTGVIFILYFGGRNVMGTGWTGWNIAAFTTFLSCFTKMALKSSKAAKLFNAVQKAQVSWKRIKPLMQPEQTEDTATEIDFSKPVSLQVSHLSFAYDGDRKVVHDLSFEAQPGEIIGITGVVASGKSTLGRLFLGEGAYKGSILVGGRELSGLTPYEHSRTVTYMGHQPELMSDTIAENISLGDPEPVKPALEAVCLLQETEEMERKEATPVGNGGVQLSGGQQARTALARALYHAGNVLVLDDPFASVDLATETQILQNMKELTKDKTVLLFSHRLTHFPEFSQVIWMDENGEEAGTHRSLMEDNAAYAALYRAQTERRQPHA